MHPILLCGIFILALTLERSWVIFRASSWNFLRFKNDLVNLVHRGDLAQAADLCKKVKSPVGLVAQAVLTSGARTEEELLNAADAESTSVLPPVTRRLNYFSLLANVSTLLGLLGTIFGLILAFSAVGAADPSQRSSFLAKGISEAMNATAFGLMMAVPALLVHGFLLSKAERILERVEEISIAVARAMAKGHRDAAQPVQARYSYANPEHAPAGRAPSGASLQRPVFAQNDPQPPSWNS
jgi:biopolymer transport protein ExbB/TolQ